MKKTDDLLHYKRVKPYLIGCVVSLIAANILALSGLIPLLGVYGLAVKSGSTPSQHIDQSLRHSAHVINILGWLTKGLWAVFLIFLVLLLLQIVDYSKTHDTHKNITGRGDRT